MTTKTGSTEMKFESTVPGPSFCLAMSGACIQLGTLTYVWATLTSAGPCMEAPLTCLSKPSKSDPWGVTLLCVYCFIVLMWLISLLSMPTEGTADPSIVDRLWSIQPIVYCWIFAALTDFSSIRLNVMTVLVTLWGGRLTYNFAIKGGFSGGEDYRWAVVRKWFPGWKFEVFNLVFICFFQQCTILAFTTPAVTAMQSSAPLKWLDAVACALFFILWMGELLADRQMWCFQTEKYRRKNAGEPLGDYARGFIETGLWAYSRHPNYFCEVSMWWAFYLFSVGATGSWLNWTVCGPIFLTLLFVPPGASIDVTEAISSSKYPAYAEYQQRVSRFVPWFPNRSTAHSHALLEHSSENAKC